MLLPRRQVIKTRREILQRRRTIGSRGRLMYVTLSFYVASGYAVHNDTVVFSLYCVLRQQCSPRVIAIWHVTRFKTSSTNCRVNIYRMRFASIFLRLQELMIEEMFNLSTFYDLTSQRKNFTLLLCYILQLMQISICNFLELLKNNL